MKVFTKTSAEGFFTRLQRAGVKKVLDVHLNNVSQLAGFAKRDDLGYFLKAIGSIEYAHEPKLAPTQERRWEECGYGQELKGGSGQREAPGSPHRKEAQGAPQGVRSDTF